ncbi:hypothetical protein JCM30760_16600 [Thiomicrorhabdus hydrogeniphila]
MSVKLSKPASYYLTIGLVLQSFLLTLLITLGYFVTPVLFDSLDTKTAGDIAGILFQISGYVTLTVLILLLLWQQFYKFTFVSIWPNRIVVLIMLLLLFWISPWMNKIKEDYPLGLTSDSADWSIFASLHGVYQVGYLIVIIALIWSVYRSVKILNLNVYK